MLGVLFMPWFLVALSAVASGAVCAYRAWARDTGWTGRLPSLLAVAGALAAVVLVLLNPRVPYVGVVEICVGAAGAGEMVPAARMFTDLMRFAFLASFVGVVIGAFHLLLVRILPFDDSDEAEQVRRTLSARGALFSCVFPFVMVATVVAGGVGAYPLVLALVDLGHALALLPLMRTVGVWLDRVGVHVILVGLWRPVSWTLWGPHCLAVGLFLVAAGQIFLTLSNPSCLRTLSLIGLG